jgi:Uma2 family endonuclease
MSTLTQAGSDVGRSTTLESNDLMQLRRFTREEFYAMVRAGIFDHDRRVELIDGRVIIDMFPIGGSHGWSVERLTRTLVKCTDGTEYGVRVQSGISLPGDRELQPDFVVYVPSERNAQNNPTMDQIILVIEVADSSLSWDRSEKMKLYAEGNIPTYWVVDVPHKRVFVYTEPDDGAYSHMDPFAGEDELEVCGRKIRVADIF